MKAETLTRLRSVARGEYRAAAGSRGVTVTSVVTPKKPGVTPVTPVTPKIDEKGKRTAEVRAPNFATPKKEDEAAIEERAGLAADSVPPVYLDTWARLNCQKPFGVSEADWRLALDDAGRFLDAWGSEAAEAEWTVGELFDIKAGLVWRLAGRQVEAIGADRVRLSCGRTILRTEMKGRG